MADVDPLAKGRPAPTVGGFAGSAAPQWHLHIPPETYGPYSLEQLVGYARDGRMNVDTLVWTAGKEAWGRAGDQPSLSALFASPARSAPPPPAARPVSAPAPTPIGQSSPSRALAGVPATGFAASVRGCLSERYFGFQGRARRSEFWWFALFMTMVTAVVESLAVWLALSTATNGVMSLAGIVATAVAGLVMLAFLPPVSAVAVRRLHDLDWSGWWYLAQLIPLVGGFIALAMLIGFMMRGTIGPNRFGPDPLEGDNL
jgi:uncharacterized membrane protein YhaH (DUF805 family)